jgi:hypothetical protein
MKPKPAITIIISLLILPSLSLGAKNKGKEIIIGLGGGYSLPVDATLRTYEHDFLDLLYFKEKGKNLVIKKEAISLILNGMVPSWGLK